MSEKKNSMVMQAGILAAAGMISRIIGLLYVSPVQGIIGTVGIGYYSSAYTYYAIILLISSYSIPSAISKVIAQKLSLREYRNAHRIFLCSLYYVLGVGLFASLLLFFGAGLFVEESAVPVLRVFAPTVFIYGVLGVLRGYFQAHRSMVQTSVSQILEQFVNAAVSIGAAYGFIVLAMGSSQVPEDPALQTRRAVYGAMGSALGTGAGVLAALLFMAGVYALNRELIQRRIRQDRTSRPESYREISRTILQVVLPFILSTAAYNLSASLNNKIYMEITIGLRGVSETQAHAGYGIFNGEASKISNIPIALSSAMASAVIPTISQLAARGDRRGAHAKVQEAVKTIMLLSIPSAAGLLVLAEPITAVLFPWEKDLATASRLLMALALSVVFYALSTLSNSILQGMGKVNTPIVHALIALAVQTGVLVPLLLYTDLGVYALVAASTVYSGVMCLLNQLAVRRCLGYRQELKTTYGIPALASLFMGGVAWAVYQALYLLAGSRLIALVPAIGIGAAVYFVLLILFRGVTEEELESMPKGRLLVRLARKCRLLH